jgi:hypothetical protein
MHKIVYIFGCCGRIIFFVSYLYCFGLFIAFYIILESPFYYRYNAHFSVELLGFDIFFLVFLGIFSLNFISKKNVFRQLLAQGQTEDRRRRNCCHMARMENRQVIPERNILRVLWLLHWTSLPR